MTNNKSSCDLLKVLANFSEIWNRNTIKLSLPKAAKRKLRQYSQDTRIFLGNHSIIRVTKKRVLKVTVDEELKWNGHTDAQCQTLSKSILF